MPLNPRDSASPPPSERRLTALRALEALRFRRRRAGAAERGAGAWSAEAEQFGDDPMLWSRVERDAEPGALAEPRSAETESALQRAARLLTGRR